jgi:multidrug efflux pump subunit AcrA (membrane-fusion protein)
MHTEVTVPNPAYELVPGMYASVKIRLRKSENALALPIQAVPASAVDEATIRVVNRDNRIEERRVTLGVRTATDVEITSGIRENEMVVFSNGSQYSPGELVVPKEVTAPRQPD